MGGDGGSAEAADQMVMLAHRVYKAHGMGDTSNVDGLAEEAKRLGVKAPDVMRRLTDLKRWKKGGAK